SLNKKPTNGSPFRFFAATRIGGGFGVHGTDRVRSCAEGLAVSGFLKTLALEVPDALVRIVDYGESGQAAAEADRLVAELQSRGDVEVSYTDGQRRYLCVRRAEIDKTRSKVPLDRNSVVLITGGARGITAEISRALAVAYRPTLILVGSSPEP